MTPDELRKAAVALFGKQWGKPLTEKLGISRQQLWRYMREISPIPGPVEAAVKCWLACQEKRQN